MPAAVRSPISHRKLSSPPADHNLLEGHVTLLVYPYLRRGLSANIAITEFSEVRKERSEKRRITLLDSSSIHCTR
jgi:hypothetical protein